MSLIKRSLPEDIDVSDPSVSWGFEGGEPVMKDITVPKQYKHLMQRERSPEYDEAVVRDYIKAHPDEVLKMTDFMKVLDGYSGANSLIKKLMKRGNITRRHKPDGTRGVKYTYQWVDTPRPILLEPKPEPGRIPILEPELDETLRDVEWNDIEDDVEIEQEYSFEERLDQYFIEYCNKQVTPEQMAGANSFRKFMHDQIDVINITEEV